MNPAVKLAILAAGLWYLFRDKFSSGSSADTAGSSDAGSGTTNAVAVQTSPAAPSNPQAAAWAEWFKARVLGEFQRDQQGNPNAWQWAWFYTRDTGRQLPAAEQFGIANPAEPISFEHWYAALATYSGGQS